MGSKTKGHRSNTITLRKYYSELRRVRKTSDDQLDYFFSALESNENFAFSRFNDGELMGIESAGCVVARGDQVVSKSLHKALIKSISHTQENYIVGIPCSICFPAHYALARSLVKQPEENVVGACILTNRNWARFISDFPKVIKGKKILWISGDDQKINSLKNEFKLKIVKHLKYPAKNSWPLYKKIVGDFESISKNSYDLVMISLGPTARIFVQQMFKRNPDKTFIDIGSTYDPFTRNIWHAYHLGWLETGFNLQAPCKECN